MATLKKRKLYIGTSGWIYPHWEKIFYPQGLESKDRLRYFSQYFKTTEINYSFYHLPRASSYQNWYSQTPRGFIFALKASRFITHIKRLKGVKEAWKIFFRNALYLKEKLGPILFQFPPSFQANRENLKRLESFLREINKPLFGARNPSYAFEFRHRSWCQEKTYCFLKNYKAAWVIADSPSYPRAEAVTADFIYLRMHGSKVLFSSNYPDEELKDWAKKIKRWLKIGDVYVYFNNDAYGYAIKNAKTLLRFCQ